VLVDPGKGVNRDKGFTSHFWNVLLKLLNVTLSMSNAYHPQTDGQSERGKPVPRDVS
jgi:hypothetical protein